MSDHFSPMQTQKGLSRIGIDAHCLGSRNAGNETYTLNLVRNLVALSAEGLEYVVYVTSESGAQELAAGGVRAELHKIRPPGACFRILLAFGRCARKHNLSLLHAQYHLPFGLKCRTVLTVHDVLFERFPHYFRRSEVLRNKAGVPASCHRADWIITVSQYCKRELVDLYGVNPDRVTVTYQGAPRMFKPLEPSWVREQLSREYGLTREFILYVGRLQERKNVSRLLDAFASLRRQDRIPHQLVIVGPRDWRAEAVMARIADLALQGEVRVTGYVPSGDLPLFYNAATVFVYPSICEGFGLPVIEAMACGTPTVTSRGSSLEEVAGDAAVLVDPFDAASIAAAIEEVITDKDTQRALRGRGIARSGQFSFMKMAEQTRQVYERVLS